MEQPRKTLTLTRKRVVIVPPPPPKPEPFVPRVQRAPPAKKETPIVIPKDFDPSKVKGPDEMRVAQKLKKKKNAGRVKILKEKQVIPNIYTDGPKVGKFAIFKAIPHKFGAHFVCIHDTYEAAVAQSSNIKAKILKKEGNVDFSLFIVELKSEFVHVGTVDPSAVVVVSGTA